MFHKRVGIFKCPSCNHVIRKIYHAKCSWLQVKCSICKEKQYISVLQLEDRKDFCCTDPQICNHPFKGRHGIWIEDVFIPNSKYDGKP